MELKPASQKDETLMNINNAFPSTYIKASELQGKRVTLTMARVQLEEVGGEHKPVLYFDGTDRGLVLNKTNSSIIAELYGPETDDWSGKVIVIKPARVEFQGKLVDAIRVELSPPAQQPQARSQAPLQQQRPAPIVSNGKAAPINDDMIDDRIPF